VSLALDMWAPGQPGGRHRYLGCPAASEQL